MADLSVFQVLDELEKKNYFLWEQLNENEQKQFHPLVLMQWMRSSGVPATSLQRVNLNLFSLPKAHQMLKLATAGTNKGRKWKWEAVKPTKRDEALKAIQVVYDTNIRGAEQALVLFSEQELDEILEEYRATIDKKETKKRR